MNSSRFAQRSLWVLFAAGLWGCAGGPGLAVTLPSSAFFEADTKEQEALRVVSRAQESRRANCQQSATCEEVTYTRGLVALFENREDAINAYLSFLIIIRRRAVGQSAKTAMRRFEPARGLQTLLAPTVSLFIAFSLLRRADRPFQ